MTEQKAVALSVALLMLLGAACVSARALTSAPSAPAAAPEARLSDVLDLTRLLPPMRETVGLALLLPLAVLAAALAQNVLGVPCLGSFTPGLLALCFARAEWRTGTAVFVVAMIFGVCAHPLSRRWKLLAAPRMGLLLTLVVFCVVAALSALDYWGVTPDAPTALLTLAIMTVVIERFHAANARSGIGPAVRSLIGTLAVGACCVALFRWDALVRLALRFPEGLFFVAAAFTLLGRYIGYRASELIRFRAFRGEGRP